MPKRILNNLALFAGIGGNPEVGYNYIVLNGRCVEVLDIGNEIIYTGYGGNYAYTKKQVKD